MERMNVGCANRIKNNSKISSLTSLKLPTTEMKKATYMDGAGLKGQKWKGKTRFSFEHDEFKMFKSDSSGDIV